MVAGSSGEGAVSAASMVVTVRTWVARRRGTAGLLAGLLLATVVTGGGVALGAIPSTTTATFTGCVAKVGGALRVVDAQAGQTCTRKERTVRWSGGWTYRGAWAAGTSYAVGDVVVRAGSSYVARTRSTGAGPAGSPLAWGLLAAGGTDGAAGSPGATGATGATGSQGPQGIQGIQGIQGEQGLPGSSSGAGSAPRLTFRPTSSTTVAANAQGEQLVACPTGTSVTGGGVYADALSDVAVMASYPFDGPDGDALPDDAWVGSVDNNGTDSTDMTVWVICATTDDTVLAP